MKNEFLTVPPCEMKEKFTAEEVKKIAKRLNVSSGIYGMGLGPIEHVNQQLRNLGRRVLFIYCVTRTCKNASIIHRNQHSTPKNPAS